MRQALARRMLLDNTDGVETPALSRANSGSTTATDIEDASAMDSLEFILAKDASLSYDSATGNAKKESLGLTSILDGEFVSVLDGEHGGTPVFVDSPEELSFGPIAERESQIFTGRRKALLVGCRYTKCREVLDRKKVLEGPYNDVEAIKELLKDHYDWDEASFRVLKDDGNEPEDQPTLDNMRAEVKQLVEGAEAGDQLFFYFSGHGTQVDDKDWDEVDGKDEVLIACDGKYLIDDELHEILVKPIPTGCRLTAVLDCCSSGTALDLPYNLFPQKQTAFPGPGRSIKRRMSKGNVVLLAATEDSKRAYEKLRAEAGRSYMMGELTRAFVKIMSSTRRSGGRRTYSQLVERVREHFELRKTLQCPQLSSSLEVDWNDYFDL